MQDSNPSKPNPKRNNALKPINNKAGALNSTFFNTQSITDSTPELKYNSAKVEQSHATNKVIEKIKQVD